MTEEKKIEIECSEAAEVCAEAYQLLGQFIGTDQIPDLEKWLDNLSEARLVHKNISTQNVKTYFKILNEINVNEKTEKKKVGTANLTYLSWAWAWAELKKIFPDAVYKIERFEHNKPYLYDENLGYMVFTEMTVAGITHSMWLPVLDGANKAMRETSYTYEVKGWDGKPPTTKTVNAATMFDVNTSLMRCLVKNIAMFGLGLYIYAGEDLPEDNSEEEKQKEEKKKKDNASIGFTENSKIDTNDRPEGAPAVFRTSAERKAHWVATRKIIEGLSNEPQYEGLKESIKDAIDKQRKADAQSADNLQDILDKQIGMLIPF